MAEAHGQSDLTVPLLSPSPAPVSSPISDTTPPPPQPQPLHVVLDIDGAPGLTDPLLHQSPSPVSSSPTRDNPTPPPSSSPLPKVISDLPGVHPAKSTALATHSTSTTTSDNSPLSPAEVIDHRSDVPGVHPAKSTASATDSTSASASNNSPLSPATIDQLEAELREREDALLLLRIKEEERHRVREIERRNKVLDMKKELLRRQSKREEEEERRYEEEIKRLEEFLKMEEDLRLLVKQVDERRRVPEIRHKELVAKLKDALNVNDGDDDDKEEDDDTWAKTQNLLAVALASGLSVLISLQPQIPPQYLPYIVAAFGGVWLPATVAFPSAAFGTYKISKDCSRDLSRHVVCFTFTCFTVFTFYILYILSAPLTSRRDTSSAPPSWVSTARPYFFFFLAFAAVIGHVLSWPSGSKKK